MSDPDCKTVTPAEQPKPLVVSKKANNSQVKLGDKITYTVTIHNPNTLPYTFTNVELLDNLTDVLDDADYNNDAATTLGAVSFFNSNLTWTGSVAPDQTAILTYSFTINDAPVGNGRLKNAVTMSSAAPADSNCQPNSVDVDCKTETQIVFTPKNDEPEPKLAKAGTTPMLPIAATGGFLAGAGGLLYVALRRRSS